MSNDSPSGYNRVVPKRHTLQDDGMCADPYSILDHNGRSARDRLPPLIQQSMDICIEDFHVPGDGTVFADTDTVIAVDVSSILDMNVVADPQNGSSRATLANHSKPNVRSKSNETAK